MNLSTNPFYSSLETRRSFLGKGTTGVGLAALAGLLNQDRAFGTSIGDFTFPNFPPKAKRVVVLWQGSVAGRRTFPYRPARPQANPHQNGGQGYSRLNSWRNPTLHHVVELQGLALRTRN